jgi:hypothetical protein
MRKISLVLALSMVLVFGLAWQAGATIGTVTSTFQSVINVPKANQTFNETTAPPPYATVDISVYDTGDASVTFTGLNDYFLGDILGINLANPDTAVESSIAFSGPYPNGTPAFDSQSASTPAQVSTTFGDFNLNLAFEDAFGQAFKDVSFYLSGDYTGVDAADILAFNSDGYDAYAHIFVPDYPGATTATVTGFAGEPVPIPAALPLFGSGLLGLIGLGWRKARP